MINRAPFGLCGMGAVALALWAGVFATASARADTDSGSADTGGAQSARHSAVAVHHDFGGGRGTTPSSRSARRVPPASISTTGDMQLVRIPATSAVAQRIARLTVEPPATSAPAVGHAFAETATVSTVTSARRTATPLNVVGSVVLNMLGVALQVFEGPPVLPRGSTVTVRTSSLTMPDTGQTVSADWYFPNNGDTPTRLIYFQHGFLANSAMYSYTIATLAQQTDSIVVAPSLSSNFLDPKADWIGGTTMQRSVADLFAGNRSALTASASTAAGQPITLPMEFVLVGHSLGGGLVTAAAGDMVANGAIAHLAGVVLLDGVDLNNAAPIALAKLTGVNYRPVEDISSEPYVWNHYGVMGKELQAARPGQFNGVMLVGGRHIDAMRGGNPLVQFGEYVVAGFSQHQNTAAERVLAAGWINDMFTGQHNGIYAAPQQSVQIPTSGGTATAIALPFISTRPVQATWWDGLAAVILDWMIANAVYQPLAA
jgi:pimeloyl-ACP methyl ester carboxylesterase